MTIRNTDAFILSCFAEDVRAIPGIHQRTIPAAQTLVTVATRYRDRLINAGHTPEMALSLLNDVVNLISDQPSEAQRRRWEREDRAEALRETRAEARSNI
jgi:hypothetical protein